MMYRLGWINWARLIIWLAIGLVVYFTYGQKHSKVQACRIRESSSWSLVVSRWRWPSAYAEGVFVLVVDLSKLVF